MGQNKKETAETSGEGVTPAIAPRDEARSDPARLFVALKLPGKIVAQLTRLCEDLKKGFGFTSCKPAWNDSETLHLTLRFLGPTERHDIEGIKEGLARIAKAHDPPNLRVMGLDVFPDWRRPRVLWIGVKDKTESLGRLQADIEGLCVRRGFEPEARAYRPHLTLARFKGMKGVGSAKDIVWGHRAFRSDRFTPAEVILFESKLSQEGASHIALARYRLG